MQLYRSGDKIYRHKGTCESGTVYKYSFKTKGQLLKKWSLLDTLKHVFVLYCYLDGWLKVVFQISLQKFFHSSGLSKPMDILMHNISTILFQTEPFFSCCSFRDENQWGKVCTHLQRSLTEITWEPLVMMSPSFEHQVGNLFL